MANVLIVAYLLIVVALIAVILLQRSEGGGLGMGSSNSNGLISVRGSANLLTRTTAILATLFFVLAITLTILAELNRGTDDILQKATETGTQPATVLDALKQLQDSNTTDLPVPATTAPSATTTDGAATTTTTAPAATTTAPATEATPSTAAPAATAPATTEQPAARSN